MRTSKKRPIPKQISRFEDSPTKMFLWNTMKSIGEVATKAVLGVMLGGEITERIKK